MTIACEVRIYLDSSALLKRVLADEGARGLRTSLRHQALGGSALVASSLAWVEVSRALRSNPSSESAVESERLADVALSGVSERPITAEVVALARRLIPDVLRSLDAIHLATAILLDADVLVSYDQRLLEAAEANGVATSSPTD